MYKFLAFIIGLLAASVCFAQDKLEAERPTQGMTPELVKGNHVQMELGFRKEKLSPGVHMYQHPTALIRYGLFNAIELRAEVVSQTIRNTISKDKTNGLRPVEFGIKAKILPEYKGFPSVGVVAQMGVPKFSSEDYYNARIPFEFRTLFQNTIQKNLKLQYNAGVRWEGENRQANWMYSITPTYEITNRFNVFAEYYAFLNKTQSAQHYIDAGVEYFVNSNFMLDFIGGVGVSELASPYFIGAGASFRLPVR